MAEVEEEYEDDDGDDNEEAKEPPPDPKYPPRSKDDIQDKIMTPWIMMIRFYEEISLSCISLLLYSPHVAIIKFQFSFIILNPYAN